MTTFEHLAMSRVSNCLGLSINANNMEFMAGTLFVKNISQSEADRAEYSLNYSQQFGKVIMSGPIEHDDGVDYAYDFVV